MPYIIVLCYQLTMQPFMVYFLKPSHKLHVQLQSCNLRDDSILSIIQTFTKREEGEREREKERGWVM